MDVVTDANGRKIAIRELGPDDMLNLMEGAGEAASNRAWMQYAITVASVGAIDDVPAPPPGAKKAVMLAFAKTLGNVGMVAVSRHLYPQAATEDAGVDIAKN